MQKEKLEKIAKERMLKLFEMAKNEEKEHSKRYVYLARKIAEKHQVSLGKYKKLFCKKCNSFFNSENSRVRIQKKDRRITRTCLECMHIQRYPFAKERLKKD